LIFEAKVVLSFQKMNFIDLVVLILPIDNKYDF